MKRRFVALALTCLVATIGWFAFAFRPAQSQIGKLRADVTLTQQQVAELETRLERLLALRDNKAGVRDKALRLVAALPSEAGLPDFIRKMQDAANSAGIDFLSVAPSLPAIPVLPADSISAPSSSAPAPSPKPSTSGHDAAATAGQPTATTPLRSITAEVTADGGFFEIESFVLSLERLGRAVKIDSLNLSAKDQPGKLSASLKVQIFMLAPQAGTSSTQPASGGV
jgi:Tfp pilus assembly protein PilO